MQELELPARHDWKVAENTYGKLVVEPFEPGFALTVGNAYRRVLLSSIHGAAPTWVKIENVLHEFSHLPGVMEDTLDIIMNLRKAVFRLHVNRPKILRLKAQGVGQVKVGDFDPDADVDILTPDVLLAMLDKDGMLEMEVCIERGRGYVPAERREPEALPINAMLLDTDFSPVKRVNFHVESVDGGRERLVLEVWTNGSVTPAAAVGEAVAHPRGPLRAAHGLPGDDARGGGAPSQRRAAPARRAERATSSATSTSSSCPSAPPTA